jgi:alkylation response protein AidB-like acyl-CoA dehydrogenase
MNLELTAEQKMIQATARDFIQTELEPIAAMLDEDGDRETFLKILRRLAELGLNGVNIKSKYGGSEAGKVALSLVITELGRACSSTADAVAVTNMVNEVIQAIGSEEQKSTYIPKMCSGEYYAGGFGLTEVTAGSDAAGVRLKARLDGKYWVLNGSKKFIANAQYAGVFIVWAVTDNDVPKGKGISIFLIENGIQGLTIGREERKMGQNAISTAELTFEDCHVPKDALMGKLNDGFRIAVSGLAGGRIGIGSMALGTGLAAMDYAVRYAKERKQFDQPITNFQAIQWMIAESYTELEAARMLLMNAAFKADQGKPFAREASMAKYYATEAAEKACYNAQQILGGYGYIKEYPIERYVRDVRITSIYEGTNQIQRLIIARDILNNLK